MPKHADELLSTHPHHTRTDLAFTPPRHRMNHSASGNDANSHNASASRLTMAKTNTASDSRAVAFSDDTLDVELKDPPLAAFLAWLVPGLGHIYQGRTGKGV